ncbi:MAG: cation transporter [Bryobacterales bacterium]|nr:cation transporter [Bryobacterales bacterium]
MKAEHTARWVALLSMAVSGLLAALKITVGWIAGSTSVLADGVEAASDVVASGVVLFGLTMASRPPDEDHPYGHGRLETLSGFVVGLLLAATGVGISLSSMQRIYEVHTPPAAYAAWALVFSIACKAVLFVWKYRYAKRTRSSGLLADAYNDSVDILSGLVALVALSLTLFDPQRFLAADHFGGLGVGFIVIFLGLRVVRDTTMQLMDTMPDDSTIAGIRAIAVTVPGALGVEKCFARKTGLQYHVDLHLEVDPELTVRQSHDIATEVRARLKEQLDWVADVLVHVEPYGELGAPSREPDSGKNSR